ncbi:MAG: hypothetical protein ACAH80_18640 [Alphaproteobacteria bacterium]
MGIMEDSVDVSFNDDNMSDDADYVPEVGEGKTIRVKEIRADAVDDFQRSQIQSNAAVFHVRVSDVAEFTKFKDKIVFKGSTYVVQSARYKDLRRYIWAVDTHLEEC